MRKTISDCGWLFILSKRKENRRKGKKWKRKANEIEAETKQNQNRNSTFPVARMDNYSLELFASEYGGVVKSWNQGWSCSALSKQKFWSLCRTHTGFLLTYIVLNVRLQHFRILLWSISLFMIFITPFRKKNACNAMLIFLFCFCYCSLRGFSYTGFSIARLSSSFPQLCWKVKYVWTFKGVLQQSLLP